MNQGLNHFGQSQVSANEKEVPQMATMDALQPDYPKYLSREDRRVAMVYMMFLK